MKLHAVEIIQTWSEVFPDDQLFVVGGGQLKDDLPPANMVKLIAWPNESVFTRAPGQILLTAAMFMRYRADYCVSLSPIVSPLLPSSRSVCFQHDWRHVTKPEDFSASQRLYRTLWKVSARRAGVNVCISEKARDETLKVIPPARTVIIENGRDHPRRWNVNPSVDGALGGERSIVTFGHQNNKRPDLVIRGFAALGTEERQGVRLVVLGARGTLRDELADLAADLNVNSQVCFPGFVSDDEYRSLISSASCIVLASSDEGFGLPLAEAEYFAIPSVVSADSGVQSLFRNAISAKPNAIDFAQAISDALSLGRTSLSSERFWTWSDTVRSLRSLLLETTHRASALG